MATVTDAEVAKFAKLSGPVRAELLSKRGPQHARLQVLNGLATGNPSGCAWGHVVAANGNAYTARLRQHGDCKAAGNFRPIIEQMVEAKTISQAQAERVLSGTD